MAKFLEVIVTSEDEAVEAEDGGADRLELVRAFGVGGLTPDTELVERVLRRVSIPVRVMVRETATLEVGGASELESLGKRATELTRLPINGLVLGFARKGQLDIASTAALLACVPDSNVTFHRAFDEAADPFLAIEQLKSIEKLTQNGRGIRRALCALPQVDRILTSGGAGDWQQRRERLNAWQAAAGDIKLLVGAGLCPVTLAGLRLEPSLQEVHVGRAAREPQTVEGKVRRRQVAALKSGLE